MSFIFSLIDLTIDIVQESAILIAIVYWLSGCKRMVRISSGIINFLLFKESRMDVFMSLKSQNVSMLLLLSYL